MDSILDRTNSKICCLPTKTFVLVIAGVYIILGVLTVTMAGLGFTIIRFGLKESENMTAVLVVNIVNGVFTLGLGIVLIVGVGLRNVLLLEVWRIVAVIHLELVILLVAWMANDILGHSGSGGRNDRDSFTVTLGIVFFVSLTSKLNVLLFLCVGQYRLQLLEIANNVGNPLQAPVILQSQSENVNTSSESPSQQQVNAPNQDPET